MAQNNEDVQLIGRHEESLKNISSETGFKYSVVDVLDNAKIEKTILFTFHQIGLWQNVERKKI